jgi:hypothetical protein
VTASVDDRLRGCGHGKRGLYMGPIRTTASRSETRPLGYRDVASFARVFREAVGSAPGAYRKR